MDIYKIKNENSRNRFRSILQLYYSKNYKACIVLLYDLTINDLYKKMISINNLGYIDFSSDIADIEKLLEGNDKNKIRYSEIERKIVDLYKKRRILGDSINASLEHLQKIRNMCAHPFIFDEEDYEPEADLVLAFITKIYNDILVVGAFIKKPYDIIEKEINEHIYPQLNSGAIFGFDELIEEEIAKTGKLLNKYFLNFTDDNLRKTFKSTLTLTIGKRTEPIQKKQYANFLVLNALLKYVDENGKNSTIENCYDWGEIDESVIIDEKSDSSDADWLAQTYLYKILSKNYTFREEIKSKNPDVFRLLESSIYNNVEYLINYWMIFETDINKIINKLGDMKCIDYCKILDNLFRNLNKESLLNIFNRMFAKVPQYNGYNDADRCLDSFLMVLGEKAEWFSQDSLLSVFECINNNRQIYDKLIGSRLDKLLKLRYDLSNYDNIRQTEDLNEF